MPTMLVVAGVNGAGKSSNIEKTRVEEYINPDKIAKEFAEKHPDQNQLRAMKGVLDRVNANIAQKKDFAIETTLASRTALNQMKRAKDAGFEVQLNYVALDTVERHVERVASRVAKGGHDISREDIERRFRTSYENLPKAIELADKVNIFDNSDKLKPVLQIDRGKILQESRNMPDHLKSHLYSLNRMTLRDKEKGREF